MSIGNGRCHCRGTFQNASPLLFCQESRFFWHSFCFSQTFLFALRGGLDRLGVELGTTRLLKARLEKVDVILLVPFPPTSRDLLSSQSHMFGIEGLNDQFLFVCDRSDVVWNETFAVCIQFELLA
jgi:hypothetical protein